MKKYQFSLFLFLFFRLTVLQSQSFTGTVLDAESKQALPFVQVYFEDLSTGTTTDLDGKFSIEHFQQKSILVQFSLMGYKNHEEIINTDTLHAKTFLLERSHLHLEEVEVSASTGKLQGDNIVSIASGKISALYLTSPLTLAEAITNLAGVDLNTTGAGIGKPVIRGLSGNRIVTYAQGIRIENQQWGDEHGLGIGAIGVEAVEVIKGPASLLYGADALGGVLYFVDERYAKHNTYESYVQSKFLSNTLGTQNSAGFKMHKGKVKFNVFGGYSSHADYQLPDGDRVLNSRFDERNLKSSLGFNTRNWISNIRYSYLQNNYGIIEGDSISNGQERNFQVPFQTIDNQVLSSENIFFTGDSKINLVLGYSNNYRREFETSSTEQALGLKLNTYTYNLKWSSATWKERIDVVVGSQGMLQSNKNNGEEILIPDAETQDLGAYLLSNIHLNRLKLQGGIRKDYRKINTEQMETTDRTFAAFNNSYSGLTFSGGAVYTLQKVKIRANVSSGFRSPNTAELLSDGVHEGSNRYEVGNAALNSENAVQMDFSIDYEGEHFRFSVNPFYTSLRNYIYLSPLFVYVNQQQVYQTLQQNATLYGGETGLHFHPHRIHWLHIENTFSTVFGQASNGDALPLIPQSKLSTTLKAEIKGQRKLQLKNIFLQQVYKFRQNRISNFETQSPDYLLLNAGLQLQLRTKKEPISIEAGVRNLLNSSYIDHLSRLKNLNIAGPGINFYLGIKLMLSGNIKE